MDIEGTRPASGDNYYALVLPRTPESSTQGRVHSGKLIWFRRSRGDSQLSTTGPIHGTSRPGFASSMWLGARSGTSFWTTTR